MAVTLEQIIGYLENMDFKYDYSKEKERILLISGDEDSTYTHFIRAKEDGDIFEWQMQILDENKDNLMIKDHKYIGTVLAHLLFLNYRTKFGTWEFDPSDGDIRLAVEIPLEDALMTEKQFKRVMSLMLRDADKHADEILHILNTGEIPKDDSEADMIAKLEAMLATLKGGDTSDSSDGI
jgi:hypothetical protein